MTSEEAVRAALDTVIDPCSAAAGQPVGLDEMGMVSRVEVRDGKMGAAVRIELLMTHPFCMMAAVLLNEAKARISALPGVDSVEVALNGEAVWTPDRMSNRYRLRLDAARRESASQ